MKLLIIVFALFSAQVNADYFIDLEVGFTHSEWSEPEVKLQAPLAKFAIGYITEYDYTIKLDHVSSIAHKDIGYGMNVLWVGKRFNF